jgi:sulfite exporter TauE/SafE
MMDFLVTSLQLAGIGFSMGLSGSCLFLCTPILATFFAGDQSHSLHTIKKVLWFLLGRLAAYVLLGTIAGLSAQLFDQFIHSIYLSAIKLLIGGMIVFLGFFILFKKSHSSCKNLSSSSRDAGPFALFSLGFSIGLSPCPPLISLLLEIILMCQVWYHGAFYGLAFGIGTLLSGMIVLGVIGCAAASIPRFLSKYLPRSTVFFKYLSACLLIGFGLWYLKTTFFV